MKPISILAIIMLASCAGAARSASAVVSAYWTPVASGDGSVGTIYPVAATTDDPTLLAMQTWDLRVITNGNWREAGMRATLPPGNAFYRSSNTGITKPEIMTPRREFWTYVKEALTPAGDPPPLRVVSGFPPGSPVSNGTANGTNTPGVLSAVWAELYSNPPPGDYDIARLTFPLGVMPDVLTADQSATFSFTAQMNPSSSVGIPEIPEPASGLLALLGLSFGATWRGRSMQRLLRRVHQ